MEICAPFTETKDRFDCVFCMQSGKMMIGNLESELCDAVWVGVSAKHLQHKMRVRARKKSTGKDDCLQDDTAKLVQTYKLQTTNTEALLSPVVCQLDLLTKLTIS